LAGRGATSRRGCGAVSRRPRSAVACGLPESLSNPFETPPENLALRYARFPRAFTAREFAARYGLGVRHRNRTLLQLTAAGKISEGRVPPGGTEREWIDPDVLRACGGDRWRGFAGNRAR
jgi:hypothetical protein